MATMTLAEVNTAIANLEAARSKRLLGGQIVKSGYGESGVVEFASSSLEEINMELTRLRLLRQSLGGCSAGVGPVVAEFGRRA